MGGSSGSMRSKFFWTGRFSTVKLGNSPIPSPCTTIARIAEISSAAIRVPEFQKAAGKTVSRCLVMSLSSDIRITL